VKRVIGGSMVVPPQRFRKILPCHCHMSSEPWNSGGIN
ncbi:hypothetical protein ABIE69_003518, partial [Rhodobacteraceae bacterium MBR-64]